jgi:hypothetical protein
MIEAQASHAAMLLRNDKILVTGGTSARPGRRPAEIYDPDTGAFASIGTHAWHGGDAATLLLGVIECLLASNKGVRTTVPVTHWKTILATALCAAAFSQPSRAQVPPQALPPTILTIDVANYTEYQADIYDASKYGTNPDKTPSAGAGQFGGSHSWRTSLPSMASQLRVYTPVERE